MRKATETCLGSCASSTSPVDAPYATTHDGYDKKHENENVSNDQQSGSIGSTSSGLETRSAQITKDTKTDIDIETSNATTPCTILTPPDTSLPAASTSSTTDTTLPPAPVTKTCSLSSPVASLDDAHSWLAAKWTMYVYFSCQSFTVSQWGNESTIWFYYDCFDYCVTDWQTD